MKITLTKLSLQLGKAGLKLARCTLCKYLIRLGYIQQIQDPNMKKGVVRYETTPDLDFILDTPAETKKLVKQLTKMRQEIITKTAIEFALTERLKKNIPYQLSKELGLQPRYLYKVMQDLFSLSLAELHNALNADYEGIKSQLIYIFGSKEQRKNIAACFNYTEHYILLELGRFIKNDTPSFKAFVVMFYKLRGDRMKNKYWETLDKIVEGMPS